MLRWMIAGFLLLVCLGCHADARQASPLSSRTVLVHGYVRSNGTVVQSYLRSPPRRGTTAVALGIAAMSSSAASASTSAVAADDRETSSIITEIGDRRVAEPEPVENTVPLPKPEHGTGGIFIGMTIEEVRQHANRVCEAPNEDGAFFCGNPNNSDGGFFVKMTKTSSSVVAALTRGICSDKPLTNLIEEVRIDIKATNYDESNNHGVFYTMPKDYVAVLRPDGVCFDPAGKAMMIHYSVIMKYVPLMPDREDGT